MGKTIGFTMAKASQEDIGGGFDLAAILDAIDKGDYPSYFATPEDRDAAEEAGIPTFFDADDFDHLKHLHTLLVDLLARHRGFSLWRLVMGMDTILRNDILDPDVDHLAINPKFAVALVDSERLDWLDRHPRLAEIVVDGRSNDCYVYAVTGAPGVKLREIIDAVMQAPMDKEASHG